MRASSSSRAPLIIRSEGFSIRGLLPAPLLIASTIPQICEEVKILPFRGALFAEESLLALTLNPGEIPHFVRNDKPKPSSRGSRALLRTGAQLLDPDAHHSSNRVP